MEKRKKGGWGGGGVPEKALIDPLQKTRKTRKRILGGRLRLLSKPGKEKAFDVSPHEKGENKRGGGVRGEGAAATGCKCFGVKSPPKPKKKTHSSAFVEGGKSISGR